MFLKVFSLLLILPSVDSNLCFYPWKDVDCILSVWGEWLPCSASCGNKGTQTRLRSYIRWPKCNGKACGHNFEERSCNRVCCPVNCVYSWGAWSSCKGCGSNGQQTSLPVLSQNAKCGGTCNAPSIRKRKCYAWK